ncbi:hypothetical protein MCOR19_006503 [Pyricularia oryzae]|nr:hypothetical protein MCOR19_006503 [Pyricularia oryzae]KAI6336322.1 hypothetical protein MCOR30_003601 [Pyricularia oryzae]KAI6383428.1 hypothetical protein MCOR32_002762 [Pyricularia oryzae]KAI6471576.1 hypothetical protein MCOR18_008742 [Pyricularia oryzae]KAI6522266.1 hypothetical protein MCOR16_007597 [Pyricularia oryzae]
MARLGLSLLAGAGALFGSALAQFPPAPEGVTVLESKLSPGVKISYKEPGLCETTPGVKSYSGYIHLPPGTLDVSGGLPQPYPINTFFWFFEARENPENAPLSVWMNGGPGSSSMPGLFNENGPCFINPDSKTTRLNPLSWNNKVNMIYIDQPSQVGFSYDVLRNVTVDLFGGTRTLAPGSPIPPTNTTFRVGTLPSNNQNSTAVGSVNGAIALWHFFQIFLSEFPGYHPKDDRFSIATQSYGGRYGPAMAGFFDAQNEKIRNGEFDNMPGPKKIINLDTLLLVNACIERKVQWPSYPEQAFRNTYGIETVSREVYESMTAAFNATGGCREQIETCQALAKEYDPMQTGVNATVNRICQDSETWCTNNIRDPYIATSGRDYYDVTQLEPTMFPDPFVPGYLNQREVQLALGVPLNWTSSSSASSTAFRSIGDYNRPGWLEAMGNLLDKGKKVTLMYGDRDFACNWMGGEAASLAIPWKNQEKFAEAGYQPLRTNCTYDGGLVRQYSNLTFARVFQAGHAAPSYQQQTAYRIFNRALFDKDVAGGLVDTATTPDFGTKGPASVRDVTNEKPPQYPYYCYILDTSSCTDVQIAALRAGTAVIRDFIMVDPPYDPAAPRLAARDVRGMPTVDPDQRFY